MIFLGKILKTRGNKGEVFFIPSILKVSSDIWKGREILLKSAKYQRKETIEYIKKIKSGFILKLLNINTLNKAFQLVGYSMYGSGVNYEQSDVGNIIGFIVRDIHGIYWGTVLGIKNFGLNMVLEIEHNNDIIYVPFNNKILVDIRKEEKLIILDPPDGLLNLNK